MTYLVVGAGFLGAYLLRYLRENACGRLVAAVRDPGASPSLPGVEYVRCDVTNGADVAALAQTCAGETLTVFYFAACHNVDWLYEHEEEARKVNIDALTRFLDTVPDIRAFFFASTDCVYGENPPGILKFKETDPCRPVNAYGRQKLEAERTVLERGFTAVRFAYMLGPSLLSRPHFYDTVYAKLRAGEPVEMIDGMVRSALSYRTAASLLARMAQAESAKLPGIFNLCSDGEYTKYELGLRIAAAANAPASLVIPISEEEAAGFFKDKRASRSVMDNHKLKSLLGIQRIEPEV